MPGWGHRKFYGTKAPTVARRRARAVTFLLNCRSLAGVTAESLAHQFGLKVAVAREMLFEEQRRRGNG